MKEHFRPELNTPDLIELLSLDQQQFNARFAGSPILRTKRRGLLRNVCVALGNVGDRSALPTLEKATLDSEPLVAEHARWAIEQVRERSEGGQPAAKRRVPGHHDSSQVAPGTQVCGVDTDHLAGGGHP